SHPAPAARLADRAVPRGADDRARRGGAAVRQRRLLDPDGAAVLEVPRGDARAAAISRGAAAAGEGYPEAVRRRHVDAAAREGTDGGADDDERVAASRHVDRTRKESLRES